MHTALSKLSRFAAIVVLAVVVPGCAIALRSPSISELQRHPGRYQDHTVSVNGVVTTSWGLPLVPFRMYKVDDGTGEVTVLSQGTRMPARGERVRVKGRVNEVAVFGGQALGLHLREESLYVRTVRSRVTSSHAVILIATAVMSSFGAVSPRNSCTASTMASTRSRALF